MLREYGGWWSWRLNRHMEFLWFGETGRPLVVFPTSDGRFYQNEDFGLVGALADRIESGELQLFCVDSVDHESWYNENVPPEERARRHSHYDQYLLLEVIPYIWNRAWRNDLMVYGASFGAYHASNFAAKHPDIVTRVICFSGIYDIHRFLDGYWDDTCYFNCPTAFIPNMNEETSGKLAKIEWIVATGEHDSLVDQNREFAGILQSKGIGVHAEIWPGVFGHDWPWWNENIRRFV